MRDKKGQPHGGWPFCLERSRVLVHGEDQIVVIVICPGAARGRAPQVAEVGADRLQSSGRQREGCGERLRSSRSWFDRADQGPRGAVGVRRVVEVQRIRREAAVRPYRSRDFHRLAVGESAAVGGGDYDAVVGFIGMECTAGAVSARAIDIVGLIGLGAAGEGISAKQERSAGIARGSHGRALWCFERRVVHRGLWTGASGVDHQRNRGTCSCRAGCSSYGYRSRTRGGRGRRRES